MVDLGAKGISFEDRHVAEHNGDVCTRCGVCVTRCNFEAFSYDGTTVSVQGKKKKNVVFDSSKCMGCGICVTTCKGRAISMVKLDRPVPDKPGPKSRRREG